MGHGMSRSLAEDTCSSSRQSLGSQILDQLSKAFCTWIGL